MIQEYCQWVPNPGASPPGPPGASLHDFFYALRTADVLCLDNSEHRPSISLFQFEMSSHAFSVLQHHSGAVPLSRVHSGVINIHRD
jgi:hypothetical protein